MATDYEKLGAFYLGRTVNAATGQVSPEPLLYDSRDLTTHAVCVGMTGSGKTGLCLALLEEAAIDGVPAICIDPKGDLANLLLNFPALAPADFEPWVDAGEAARKGLTPPAYAAEVAQQWQKGLAEWDQTPARIAKLRDAVDMAIYTPGADSGLPLSVLRSFDAPPEAQRADAAALAERVTAVVSGLLTLLGRDADPLQSRDHILLSTLLSQAWAAGQNLDLGALVGLVQKPPLQKLGALDLESFYPAKERRTLALALNTLLASPSFAAWTRGAPLDAQSLLFTPEGKPRIAIVSIAHLSDAERMFVVTLLLNEMIAWMRRQSGTSSLRAVLYMDEIFGYFPPTANPPSKPPMLTLLKQARAFGVGCVLATQNPVDLDYKGLGNTGTWFIGRLQTERDRDRLLDGLTSALGGSDRSELAALLSQLQPRSFLMRNARDNAPQLLRTRWTLSWLRGPLTPAEISRLMAPRKSTAAAPAPAQAGSPSPRVAAAAAAVRPAVPDGCEEYFAPLQGSADSVCYLPRVLATAKLHFVDAKLAVDAWQTRTLLAGFNDDGSVDWATAETSTLTLAGLQQQPVAGAAFAELPAAAGRTAYWTAAPKALAAQLYETARATVLACDAPKLASVIDEPEGEFRARLALQLREQRDARVEALSTQYAVKLSAAQQAVARAQATQAREQAQASQQKLQTVLAVGATVLGAFFGRKALSATTLNRVGAAARSASRIGSEAADAERATLGVEAARQKLDALQQELQQAVTALEHSLDATSVPLRSSSLAARKTDILVGKLVLLWLPQHAGS
jgi:hypothetical protein